jgi:hypothetical protein
VVFIVVTTLIITVALVVTIVLILLILVVVVLITIVVLLPLVVGRWRVDGRRRDWRGGEPRSAAPDGVGRRGSTERRHVPVDLDRGVRQDHRDGRDAGPSVAPGGHPEVGDPPDPREPGGEESGRCDRRRAGPALAVDSRRTGTKLVGRSPTWVGTRGPGPVTDGWGRFGGDLPTVREIPDGDTTERRHEDEGGESSGYQRERRCAIHRTYDSRSESVQIFLLADPGGG